MRGRFRVFGNAAIIATLFVVLFSYAMFQGGFVSWFLFFSFLPIFFYLLVFLFYPMKKWNVTREVTRPIIQAGDKIDVMLRIKRNIPFPIYYCIVEEVFPVSLMKADSSTEKYRHMDHPEKRFVERKIKKVVFPGFKRSLALPYTIEQVPRGEHQLKGIRVKLSDIFGFVKREHLFNVSNELIAYPTIRPITMQEQYQNFEQGSVSSSSHQLMNTNVAIGVREYVPGDRFSRIDWKQTARRNNVMTKEFEQEKSTDILLILDSCHYEGMNALAFEASVELSLSLMNVFRKQGNQAGLLSIGAEAVYFQSEQNAGAQARINHFLARIQPNGERSFSISVKEEMKQIKAGQMAIVITTRIDDFFKQSMLQVKQRTKRIAVIFIQATDLISEAENHAVLQLRYAGIGVQIMTEQQLVHNPIEVNIR